MKAGSAVRGARQIHRSHKNGRLWRILFSKWVKADALPGLRRFRVDAVLEPSPDRRDVARLADARGIVDCGHKGPRGQLAHPWNCHQPAAGRGGLVSRPGRPLGFMGGNYEVSIPGVGLFFVEIHTLGGSVPVHRFWIQLDCPLICW
jgi:hypothetical protein